MFKGKVVVFALMLMFATSVYAGDVNDCYSDAGLSCTLMQISICPAGDFEFIRTACGGTADYIWITAMDSSNQPISGIPWSDYWLNACDPTHQLCLCSQPIQADSLTGANGRTTFSTRIAGGGCTLSQGIWWAIQGKSIKAKPACQVNLCLNVIIKGPDINGPGGNPDCLINLSDLTPFGVSYNKNQGQAGFNACCDYNDDTHCNLSDFGFFGTHYQHRCL